MAIIKKATNNKCKENTCTWLTQPLCNTVWRFLRKLKIELLYDPAIPLLHIYLKETRTLIWKYICIALFIAALFIIAKIWIQPKCLSTHEKQIKKMNAWDIYIYIYIHTHIHIYIHTHTHWDTIQS